MKKNLSIHNLEVYTYIAIYKNYIFEYFFVPYNLL